MWDPRLRCGLGCFVIGFDMRRLTQLVESGSRWANPQGLTFPSLNERDPCRMFDLPSLRLVVKRTRVPSSLIKPWSVLEDRLNRVFRWTLCSEVTTRPDGVRDAIHDPRSHASSTEVKCTECESAFDWNDRWSMTPITSYTIEFVVKLI
jgi:hypothetical protein